MKTGITIPVKDRDGNTFEVTVAAVVRGDWAIHRTPMSEDRVGDQVWESWALTHVPTGMAFINAAPSPGKIRRALAEIRLLPVDWSHVEPGGVSRPLRRLARYIRNAYNTGGRWRHRPLCTVAADQEGAK